MIDPEIQFGHETHVTLYLESNSHQIFAELMSTIVVSHIFAYGSYCPNEP